MGALARSNGDLDSAPPSMDFIVLRGFAPTLNSAAPFILIGTYIYTLALGCQDRPNGVTQPRPKSTGRGREVGEKFLPRSGEVPRICGEVRGEGWHRRGGPAALGKGLRNFSA